MDGPHIDSHDGTFGDTSSRHTRVLARTLPDDTRSRCHTLCSSPANTYSSVSASMELFWNDHKHIQLSISRYAIVLQRSQTHTAQYQPLWNCSAPITNTYSHRRTGRGSGGQLTPQFGQIYDIYSGKRQHICLTNCVTPNGTSRPIHLPEIHFGWVNKGDVHRV